MEEEIKKGQSLLSVLNDFKESDASSKSLLFFINDCCEIITRDYVLQTKYVMLQELNNTFSYGR